MSNVILMLYSITVYYILYLFRPRSGEDACYQYTGINKCMTDIAVTLTVLVIAILPWTESDATAAVVLNT